MIHRTALESRPSLRPEGTSESEKEGRLDVFISTYPEYVKSVYKSVRKS